MKYFEPWEHIIIDDHYSKDLFDNMLKELTRIALQKNETKAILHFKDSELNKFPYTRLCVNSIDSKKTYLPLFDSYRRYKTIRHFHEVIMCFGEVDYNIHDEVKDKVLSSTTYVWASKQGTGTVLYDKEKNFVKEVEWLPNRCLIFCGETGKTWHSYYSTPDNIRITVNTFLVKM